MQHSVKTVTIPVAPRRHQVLANKDAIDRDELTSITKINRRPSVSELHKHFSKLETSNNNNNIHGSDNINRSPVNTMLRHDKDHQPIAQNIKLIVNNPSQAYSIAKTTTTHKESNKPALDSLSIMDKSDLVDLLVEKTRRIQELESMLDDQKRLRLQDASQVEEKAAKIKEWVANKLKELEKQNKVLRDQNKKQKQTIDLLTVKLSQRTSLTISAKNNGDPEKYHDEENPTTTTSKTKEHNKLDDTIVSHAVGDNCESVRPTQTLTTDSKNDLTKDKVDRSESPIYDSVNFEQQSCRKQDIDSNKPPPPPMHRVDDWELQLYSQAEENLNSLINKNANNLNHNRIVSQEATSMRSESFDLSSDRDTIDSHKSMSSLKNDLILLIKPHLTTIDGDEVLDDNSANPDGFECVDHDSVEVTGKTKSHLINQFDPMASFVGRRKSNENDNKDDQSQRFLTPTHKILRDSKYRNSCDNISRIGLTPTKTTSGNLFDTPLRARRRPAEATTLRAHSVRKNPTPEKLHEFLASDLVKRGYLTKPGALKNHQRWFVLKDLNLSCYKSESDEIAKMTPSMRLKLDHSCHIFATNQTSESNYPFRVVYTDKTLQLVADTAQKRDDWVKIMKMAINMANIDPKDFTKQHLTYEGLMSYTRHGSSKRCYAILTKHVLILLKSLTDPTPLGYISVKEAKIREITINHDYDIDECRLTYSLKNNHQDCHLAIYPKYSFNPDPVYITLGSQVEIDKWFYHLSMASGVDQSSGTPFEKLLTKIMLTNSLSPQRNNPNDSFHDDTNMWKEHPIMMYSERPITEPLTTLPNENLRIEAIELFKSILLFIQVPIEPMAIDYHISLLQNCLARFLKNPELRNEFYAQLIKQSTFVVHRCTTNNASVSIGGGRRKSGSTSTGSSSGCSPTNNRLSSDSLTPSSSECQCVVSHDNRSMTHVSSSIYSSNQQNQRFINENSCNRNNADDDERYGGSGTPTNSQLLQVMQILSIAVSLNLPRARIKWWLTDFLNRFADLSKNIGKYALYTLKAIERTLENGPRENIPSRTEIIGMLLRNPYDHSHPHSLPVTFPDGSYLVVGADGSTTVDEFMETMAKTVDIRHSSSSDFYLFADDPADSNELHILEPQRKIFDIVGWWEQTMRKHNSGRYQSTKVIKILCKKRLILRTESAETAQERLMIVHQASQEVVASRLPISDPLSYELAAIMSQLTFGNFEKSADPKLLNARIEKIWSCYMRKTITSNDSDCNDLNQVSEQILRRWRSLNGRSAQECVRVYLNCIRRLKIDEH